MAIQRLSEIVTLMTAVLQNTQTDNLSIFGIYSMTEIETVSCLGVCHKPSHSMPKSGKQGSPV